MTDKRLGIWYVSIAVLALFILWIGGVTRLTRSGLSITEWKPVTGVLPPLSAAAWNEEFLKYQATPEFTAYNSQMKVDGFKFIYFWEWMHRLIARLLGLLIMIPAIWFLIKKKFSTQIRLEALWLLFLVLLQGMAGWYMVKSGLSDNPHVSPYRLAVHLALALSLIGFSIWYALPHFKTNFAPASIKEFLLSIIIPVLLFVQMIYGALTAGFKAGHISSTWPNMLGEFYPEKLLETWQPWIINFYKNPAMVLWFHRLFGLILLITLPAVIYFIWKKINTSSRKLSAGLLILLVLQVVLGIITVLSHVQMHAASTHQVVSVLLFGTSLALCRSLKP